MSTTPESNTPGQRPSRRDQLRPLEYLGMAGIVALFIGLVVLGSTREVVLSLVFFGVAFIVSLVVIAMLALAAKPTAAEQDDLDEQNNASGH